MYFKIQSEPYKEIDKEHICLKLPNFGIIKGHPFALCSRIKFNHIFKKSKSPLKINLYDYTCYPDGYL